MVLGVGDSLSVRLSAQTRDFTAGIDRAQEAASDLAVRLQFLQGRADEAGDELTQVGAQGQIASSGLFAASLGSRGASVSFLGLSGVTVGALIPALFTLSAALTPIVSAFTLLTGGAVALGGAFGAVIGLGIAGGFQEIKDAILAAVDSLEPFVRLVGSQFTPLILDAVEAGRQLAFDVLAIVGENADTFADALASLGAQVADVIPGLVESFFTLAETALPVFQEFVGFLDAEGGDILTGIAANARSVIPDLNRLLGAVLEFIPAFAEFGAVAAQQLIPALTRIVNVGTRTLNFISTLDPQIQALVASASLLAPVLTTIGSALLSLNPIGAALIALVAGLTAAWQTNFGNIRQIVQRTVTNIRDLLDGRLGEIIANFRQFAAAVLPVIEPAFNALIQLIGIGATQAIDSFTSILLALSQVLTGDFTGALETLGGLFERTLGRVADAIQTFVGGALQTLVNAAIGALNFIGANIEDFSSFIGGNFQFERFENVSLPTVSETAQQLGSEPPVGQSEPRDQRIIVELRDDKLKGEIDSRVSERQRRNDIRLRNNV